ncbi:MAG: Glu-tRNA(Gln) amidotransferase subunit GatE, partial [Candidatus Cloacimonadota bacterium]|nr:Glu-tRNA(Gln) amidotransferase subunit GatE [Candidatus Cloacimonadota bacterium]
MNRAKKNFEQTKKAVEYVQRKDATIETYEKIGFMSGLEVHQQLKTEEKLFCRCKAGIYHDFDNYDAEVIRHMRPTLSELGEYDGTALMEFRTRKNITYRINNETACTYEIDDTPPFSINRQALNQAIEISLLLKQNVVGELHIARKQYLDGSIPTGFQRTAIVGIEGEFYLREKRIGVIQMSIEEDSCREVSDIGHERIYVTDRLGMPLIETVTYPDMLTPEECMEACHYIRFLNRSTGKVRTGIGAGRQDVNVSVTGGTRVEIKGVHKIVWIPELTHNEAFRQRSLLIMKDRINSKITPEQWKKGFVWKEIDKSVLENIDFQPLKDGIEKNLKLIIVNLPKMNGFLSHFTQPEKPFIEEISTRLKVIAGLEKPNHLTSEDLTEIIDDKKWDELRKLLNSNDDDAQILFWTSDYDQKIAIETIEERCLMIFDGVPNETRKSLKDGTTIFERVLPGADRMYPDTDSAPISISSEEIKEIRNHIPVDLAKRMEQLAEWKAPIDVRHFILRNNLMPIIERIIKDFDFSPKFVTTVFGHKLKYCFGKTTNPDFDIEQIYYLFKFVEERKLENAILPEMMVVMYENESLTFDKILEVLDYKKY